MRRPRWLLSASRPPQWRGRASCLPEPSPADPSPRDRRGHADDERSGTGAASGTSFNGGTAQTVSYNTIGAPSTTGTGASGTWAISISGNAATATSASSATTATTTSNIAGGAAGSIPYQTGSGATSFTAPSGTVKPLVYYDGSNLATDATVTDAGYDTSTNTLTANNFSASGSATAGSFKTTNFTIIESGGSLLIKYGATTIASISSTGVITSAVNIISNGTP